ncbi:MKRN2 opposite strand protein isoform X1 [Podarcis raffonei]|uniref:MKRN2 opposite strand protein isoform X1 n=2 Tax=Podarcis raffonei TaxID=65483 RepID=UPI0023295D4D|nr:MKRN2 opposite strand protein isoform X1 [Podarcis raffonei]
MPISVIKLCLSPIRLCQVEDQLHLHKEEAEIMQPLDSERGLIKISHCKRDIFGSFVPKHCPLCGQSLFYRKLEEAPVTIPSPFVNGHRERCSFLLKPTTGTFLRGYDGSSDLHVGITNTNGLVYNYNETGVNIAEHGWEQCVSVHLVQPDMYGLLNQWDTYLEQFSAAEIWLPHRYEEHLHNCYTYALTFINCVLSAQKKQQMNKSEFTERFVIPRTRKASKYITIYKEICKNGFYAVDLPAQEGTAI